MSTATAAPATATVAAPAPALASPAADLLPAFSFWGGPDPVPLPQRFARIKRNLIAGHEAELKASWARLVHALRAEVEHIEGLGPHLIPSIEFSDIDDPAQTARFGRDLRRYGVGVVRKTLPRPDADAAVRETVRYLDQRRPPPAAAAAGDRWTGPDGGGGGPTRLRALKQDPTCFDCFWTPAQVLSRAHLNVLRAQGFMMSLWETGADDLLVTRLPITYVDRIRVEGGGFDAAAVPSGSAPGTDLASPDHGRAVPSPWPCQRGPPPPAAASLSSPPGLLLAGRSADDWITALQSSAGVIAQVDNGSLERWEPDGYGRGGTYDRIFHGNWEQYDPWECASRVSATIDLYNGYGSCSIFRMFQGLLALSTIEPGMLRLLPSPKLTTAYYLLRPFFSPRLPAPAARSGPAWEAYLSSDNWELQADPDTIIHGAVPGHSQRLRERWHPHLHLRSSLVTLPTLQPGDYILWHPDLPYHFNNTASRHQPPPQQHHQHHHQHHHYHHHYHCHHQPSPDRHAPAPAPDDVRMLIYVSAAPLTQTNALYLARQRKAFQRGHPGPDFDTSGLGIVAEDPDRRPGEADIARVGGPPALRAMGLAPWDDGLVDAAEADVVGLANRILFPK